MRTTGRALSKIYRAARVADPQVQPQFTVTAKPGDKALLFGGVVSIAGTAYECAADSGKIAKFADVDDFVRFCAKHVETSDGSYQVRVETGDTLVASLPANMATWAEAEIVRLGKRKIAQNEVIAGIDAQLDLMVGWAVGNALQRARLAEVTAQRSAVVADISAIDAEIARLTP